MSPGVSRPGMGSYHLEQSGYIRMQAGEAVLIIDVAPIGPDYLPGHGHADTLSFEFSIGSQRILVNSGTSTYSAGAERLRQRGTAAHNTVSIDGHDSSEVWSAFRVARRAYPFGLEVSPGEMKVACSHDGYTRLASPAVHTRKWSLSAGRLIVRDSVGGSASAVARFHVHPGMSLKINGGGDGVIEGLRGAVRWRHDRRVELFEGSYHPEFGREVPAAGIAVRFDDDSRMTFEW